MGALQTSWTILSIVLTIVFVIAFVWFIINPIPVKYVFSFYVPKTIYEPNKNRQVINNDYTLYTSETSKHDRLVIVIPGGAGLFNGIDNLYGLMNTLNENLGPDYDILSFSYPVRFKNTIHDAMLRMNEVLKNFLHYEHIHAIGISFGALLIGAFYNKELKLITSQEMNVPQIGMNFKSFIGICGMYETTFNVNLLSWLFRVYIMRNTPGINRYTCYGMSSVPRFIVSANSDFLIAQSMKYIKHEPCVSQIYETTLLPHAFPQFINLDDAQDSLKRIVSFIKNVDDGGHGGSSGLDYTGIGKSMPTT